MSRNNFSLFKVLCATRAAACAALLFLPAAAFAADEVRQTYDFKDFNRLDLAGIYDVTVIVGKDYSVAVSGPRDEVARLDVKLEGKTLVLDQEEEEKFRFRMNSRGVDVYITMPTIVALDVAGIVDAEISNIDSEELSVDLSGIGDVSLRGECVSLTLSLSGIGDLDAEDLRCRTVEVDVSGLGKATVYAIDAADADVSGMGSIEIYGSPKLVRRESSFFAEITVR